MYLPVGGAVVECLKKIFPLILMKLRDVIVMVMVSKICVPSFGKKMPGSASSTFKSVFEKLY